MGPLLKQWMPRLGLLACTVGLLLPAWAETGPSAAQPQGVPIPAMELGLTAKEIPAGSKVEVRFETPLDSRTAKPGDPFLAETAKDLWSGDQLIIPAGSAVRGRVAESHRPGFFSKGGLMKLDFDHVLMPSGELKSLAFSVDAASAKMSASKGALYTDPGVGSKLNSSVDKGINQYKGFQEKGAKAAAARGGGFKNKLITAPPAAIAGVATGAAVTTGNAAKAVFGKGQAVTIVPGETLLLDFSQREILPGQ